MSEPGFGSSVEFDALPVDEQIEYVQRLWERIAASADPMTAPGWHLEVVRERLAAHQASPEEALPYSEVRGRLEKSLRQRKG